MSNRRSIFYLLALLALACGVNLWMDIVGDEHGEVVRRRSLVGDADSAVAIEIVRPEGAALRLERTERRWRIASPFKAAADETAVVRLVDALAFGAIVGSTDREDAAKLGKTTAYFELDRPKLVLRVFTPKGGSLVSFGGESPSGEGVIAAVDGSRHFYLVPGSTFEAANLPVDTWRRHTVFSMKADDVTSIDLRRGESTVRLAKSGERWEIVEPKQALASAAAVNRILDTVLSLTAKEFVWPVGASNETAVASVSLLAGYGLDPETTETVVFRARDGRDHPISFGSAADAESVYALVHGGTTVAKVAASAKASVTLDVATLIDGRLFPVEKSAVQRISLMDGETAYLLARGEGGLWRIDSPVSAAADETAVAAFLDKLLVMHSSDLDEHGVKVSLATNVVPVVVSRSALLGAGGFEQFRSKVILDIDSTTVKRLVFARDGAENPESVVYDPDRKGWNVDTTGRAGKIDQPRLDAALAALSPLKAKSVAHLKVAPGELARYGLEKPTCTIAIDRLLENSVRRNILLGGVLNAEGDTYATVGSSDAVFVLDGATVKTLTAGVLSE